MEIETSLATILENNSGLNNDIMQIVQSNKAGRRLTLFNRDKEQLSIQWIKLERTLTVKDMEDVNQLLIKKEMVNLKIAKDKALEKKERFKYCSLHSFNNDVIHKMIRNWKLNDIDHQKESLKMMQILCNHQLSGDKIITLGVDETKHTINDELLSFMSIETINIIFNRLDDWIKSDEATVKTTNAAKIGRILYEYPLNRLLESKCVCGGRLLKISENEKIEQNKTKKSDVIHKMTRRWNLNEKVGKNEYVLGVCTVCNKNVSVEFRCDRERNDVHPEGYDICKQCYDHLDGFGGFIGPFSIRDCRLNSVERNEDETNDENAFEEVCIW